MKPSTEKLIADLIRATSTYCEYDNLVDLLEQAIDAITSAPIWQPIETAPKNGTLVDLWVQWSPNSCSRVNDAVWGMGEVHRNDGYHSGMNWKYHCPYANEETSLTEGFATHWMQCPGNPK